MQLRENLDDFERSYPEAKSLLDAHPDLAGIYDIGAGNRGIARALEESGRAGEVVFIGHELTEHTRRFLLSGVMDAVIDQSPRLEARKATHALAEAARGQTVDRAALAIGMQVSFVRIFHRGREVWLVAGAGTYRRRRGRVALLRDRRCTFIERKQAKGMNGR